MNEEPKGLNPVTEAKILIGQHEGLMADLHCVQQRIELMKSFISSEDVTISVRSANKIPITFDHDSDPALFTQIIHYLLGKEKLFKENIAAIEGKIKIQE